MEPPSLRLRVARAVVYVERTMVLSAKYLNRILGKSIRMGFRKLRALARYRTQRQSRTVYGLSRISRAILAILGVPAGARCQPARAVVLIARA